VKNLIQKEMESLQKKFESEVALFQKTQKDLTRHINQRQLLESQLTENQFVKEELEKKSIKRTLGDLSDDENDVEPEPKKPQMTPEEFEELCSKPFVPGHVPLSKYQNKDKSYTYEQLKMFQINDYRGHPSRIKTPEDGRDENRCLAAYDFYNNVIKRKIEDELDARHAKSSNAIVKEHDMCPLQPETYESFFVKEEMDMFDIDFQEEMFEMEQKLRQKFKEDPKAPELNPKAKHVMVAIIKFMHQYLHNPDAEENLQKTIQDLTEKGIVIPILKKFKELLERYGFQRGDRKVIMCAFLYVLEKVLPKKIKPEERKRNFIEVKTEFTKNFDRKKRVFKNEVVKTKTKKKRLMNAEEHITYYRESLFHIFKKHDPRFEKTMNHDFGVHFYGPLLLATMKETDRL